MSEAGVKPRLSYLVGRLDRALFLAIGDVAAEHGITVHQYTALSVLGRHDGLSNAELARRSFVRPQSMFAVVDALERGGLIERAAGERNRRVLRASITAKGRDVLGGCDARVGALEEKMLGDLTAQQREQLSAALRSCTRQLRPACRRDL